MKRKKKSSISHLAIGRHRLAVDGEPVAMSSKKGASEADEAAEKQVEMWKVKKLIKSLTAVRG